MQVRGPRATTGQRQITTHSRALIGRDNIRPFGLDIHNPVFVVSSLTSIAFVAAALLFRDVAGGLFEALYAWLTSTFDWVFMAAANILVLFCLLLLPSRLGRIRLGGPDARRNTPTGRGSRCCSRRASGSACCSSAWRSR